MKNFFFLAVAAGLLTAASCNKQIDGTASLRRSAVTDEIAFRYSGLDLETYTKAVTPVTELDSFNVAAVTGSSKSEYAYAWNSQTVTFTKDGTTSSYKGGKFWPDQDPKYHFFASNATMTIAAKSAPTITAANTTDIICAYLETPEHKKENTLKFNHIFARLGTVTVNGVDGYTASGVSIAITPDTGGTYDMLEGNGKTDGTGWSGKTAGSAVTIASAMGTNAATDTYLVPGSYSLTVKYTLTMGDFTRSYTKTGTVALTAGKINNITATLPKPGSDEEAKEIIFKVAVTPWTEENVIVRY